MLKQELDVDLHGLVTLVGGFICIILRKSLEFGFINEVQGEYVHVVISHLR